MSDADFAALATTWHDFYLTAGAAAATLVGLLFVGISINLDEFTTDEAPASGSSPSRHSRTSCSCW